MCDTGGARSYTARARGLAAECGVLEFPSSRRHSQKQQTEEASRALRGTLAWPQACRPLTSAGRVALKRHYGLHFARTPPLGSGDSGPACWSEQPFASWPWHTLCVRKRATPSSAKPSFQLGRLTAWCVLAVKAQVRLSVFHPAVADASARPHGARRTSADRRSGQEGWNAAIPRDRA